MKLRTSYWRVICIDREGSDRRNMHVDCRGNSLGCSSTAGLFDVVVAAVVVCLTSLMMLGFRLVSSSRVPVYPRLGMMPVFYIKKNSIFIIFEKRLNVLLIANY